MRFLFRTGNHVKLDVHQVDSDLVMFEIRDDTPSSVDSPRILSLLGPIYSGPSRRACTTRGPRPQSASNQGRVQSRTAVWTTRRSMKESRRWCWGASANDTCAEHGLQRLSHVDVPHQAVVVFGSSKGAGTSRRWRSTIGVHVRGLTVALLRMGGP